jgi:DNA-binding beta-propeller fold protein YncE
VILLLETDPQSNLRLAGWGIGAALIGWTLASVLTGGLKGVGRAALAVSVAALLALTVRASGTASFENDDTPVDMLVYTQTSPELVAIRDRIDALAQASGLGYNLPIVIDPTDGFAWPWAWYLRHYHSFSYVNPATPNYRPPEGAVLLVARSNATNVPSAGYSLTPYKHRWWFIEEGYRGKTYEGMPFSEKVSTLTSLDALESMGRFFLHRRDAAAYTGSVDAVAFFPESLAAFDVSRQPPSPPPEPVRQTDGRIVIGRSGVAAGELLQPAGLHVDGQGNIWVADSRNSRVQKYDAQGNLIGVIGRGGNAPGSFNEPWAVTTDAAGNVYVADTWNHRIQKFSPSLEFIATWGEPGPQQDANLLQLFGPRAIAIDGEGNLWVTDTGNKRLIRYAPDGTPLSSYGSAGSAAGQFNEPVGLAYDAQGRLYVADAWNARIQRFEADFGAPSSFAAGWSSQEVIAKPYLTVLRDGRIVATDLAKGLLILFDASGRQTGTWRPTDGAQPLGVAATPDGGLVFSDARRNELQFIPANLIDQLFR